MRLLLKLLLALIFATPAWAQYTTVTAVNLTDYCGFPLANVPYNASLIVPADATTQPTFTGTTTIVPQQVVVGQLTDAYGSLSMQLADNAQISTGSVTSTQWKFNIGTTSATAIGASGSPWINVTFTTAGPTLSITALVQAAMPVYPCPVAGDPHNLLSTKHPDTTPYTPPEIGDLIRGSLTQKWERFAKGTASQLLAMNSASTLPTWQNFNFYQDSLTPVNAVGRLGVNLIEGSNITITPADDAANNRVNYTVSSVGGGATACDPGEIMTGITAGGAAICSPGFFEGRSIGMDLPIKQSGGVRQFIKTIINNTSCGFGTTGVTDPSASIPYSTFFITANTSLLAAPISCYQTYVGSFNAEQDPILWSTLTTEGTSSSDMFWGFSNMSGPNACGFPDATPPLPPVSVVQVGFAGYHGGNWKGFVHDGATYSTCDTGVSADGNITAVPVKLSYSNATGITKFYMSNVLKCSVTLDLPATNIYMQRCVITRGTATARTLRLGSVFWTYKEP